MTHRTGPIAYALGSCTALLAGGAAWAEEPAGPRSDRLAPTTLTIPEIRELHQSTPPPEGFTEHLDQLHDEVYTLAQAAIEATDHALARRDREIRPVPANPFRLGMFVESVDRSDGWQVRLDADFSMRLRLPNVQDRLRLFVTSEELDESPHDARTDHSLRAGVAFDAPNRFDFAIGVRLNLPVVGFASVRWTETYALGAWDVYPLAKVFAETRDGLGASAAITFDRWDGTHLFRSSSYARWSTNRDQTEWTQTLIYSRVRELLQPDRYDSFVRASDIGRGWGLRLLASGGEDNRNANYYEAALFLRRPARTRWLYWFVEPLVRWDRTYDWSADAGIRIGFDALFWDLARHPPR